MKKLQLIIRYLKYLLSAKGKRSAHAPFLYTFITKILNAKTENGKLENAKRENAKKENTNRGKCKKGKCKNGKRQQGNCKQGTRKQGHADTDNAKTENAKHEHVRTTKMSTIPTFHDRRGIQITTMTKPGKFHDTKPTTMP